jgi:hypothetical protein
MNADPVPGAKEDDYDDDWTRVVVSILVLDREKDSLEDFACWQSWCWNDDDDVPWKVKHRITRVVVVVWMVIRAWHPPWLDWFWQPIWRT